MTSATSETIARVPHKMVPSASGCDISISHVPYIRFKDYVSNELEAHKTLNRGEEKSYVFAPTVDDLRSFGFRGSFLQLQAIFAKVQSKFDQKLQLGSNIRYYLVNKILVISNSKLKEYGYFLNYDTEGYHLDSKDHVSFEHLVHDDAQLKKLAIKLNEADQELNAFWESQDCKVEIDRLMAPTRSDYRRPRAEYYEYSERISIEFDDIAASCSYAGKSRAISLDSTHLSIWNMQNKVRETTLEFSEERMQCCVCIPPQGNRFFTIDSNNQLLIWEFNVEKPKLLDLIPLKHLVEDLTKTDDLTSSGEIDPTSSKDLNPALSFCDDTLIIYWHIKSSTRVTFWPLRDFDHPNVNNPAFSQTFPKLTHVVFTPRIIVSARTVREPVVKGNHQTKSEISFWTWPDFEKIDVTLASEEPIDRLCLAPANEGQIESLIYIQNDGRFFLLDLKTPYKPTAPRELFKKPCSSALYLNANEIVYIDKQNTLRIWNFREEKIVGEYANTNLKNATLVSNFDNQLLVQNEKDLVVVNRENFARPDQIRRPIEDVKFHPKQHSLSVLEKNGYFGQLNIAQRVYQIRSMETLWNMMGEFKSERVFNQFAILPDQQTVIWIVREDGVEPAIRKVALYSVEKNKIFFSKGERKPAVGPDRLRAVTVTEDVSQAHVLTNTHLNVFDVQTNQILKSIKLPTKIPNTLQAHVCCGKNNNTVVFGYGNTLGWCNLAKGSIYSQQVNCKKVEYLALSPSSEFLAIELLDANEVSKLKIIKTALLSQAQGFDPLDQALIAESEFTHVHLYNELLIVLHEGKVKYWMPHDGGVNLVYSGPLPAAGPINKLVGDYNLLCVKWEGTELNLTVQQQASVQKVDPLDLTAIQVVPLVAVAT